MRILVGGVEECDRDDQMIARRANGRLQLELGNDGLDREKQVEAVFEHRSCLRVDLIVLRFGRFLC